jgi:hypothetical protein
MDYFTLYLGVAMSAMGVVFMKPNMNFGGGIKPENFIKRYAFRYCGWGSAVGLVFGCLAARQAFEIYYIDHFDEIPG